MTHWSHGFGGAFTVCDEDGTILEMSPAAAELFAQSGGSELIGRSVLDCHPEPSRTRLASLMAARGRNVYTTEKDGRWRLIFQGPWQTGAEKGYLELSFDIPADLPHRVRDQAPVQPVLETDRLVLRPLRLEDAPRVAALADDRSIAEQTRLPFPYLPECAVNFIDSLPTEWKKERAAVFAICLKNDGAVVGTIGLHVSPMDRSVAETGYWLGFDFHGNGYATEAARRVCGWGLSEWGLRRISACTHGGNVASERVLTKVGFAREGVQRAGVIRLGVVRDIVLWGLLRDELR
jgi:ribosomal-protein-alanine N-acetyltransferase